MKKGIIMKTKRRKYNESTEIIPFRGKEARRGRS
jgi:hypothetical protein